MVKVIGVGDCMVDKKPDHRHDVSWRTGFEYCGQYQTVRCASPHLSARSATIILRDHMKKKRWMKSASIIPIPIFYHAPNAFARYKVIDNDRVFPAFSQRPVQSVAGRNPPDAGL